MLMIRLPHPMRQAQMAFGAGLVLLPMTANAAGGAHVVDDAAVETPGTCHVESWMTRHGDGGGRMVVAPACTREAWPALEIGAVIQHDRDGATATAIGPAFKFNLRSAERGVGVALATSASISLDHGTLDGMGVTIPVSFTAGRRLAFNLNAGWTHARGAGRHHDTLFLGAQAELQLAPDVGVMVEAYGHDHGTVGGQMGVRWTPRGGSVDVDLIAGRLVDGVGRNAVTLGVTIRR